MNRSKNSFLPLIFLIILCACKANLSYGQRLEIKPYQLISQKKDTISAELNIYKVPLDRTRDLFDSIEIHFVRLKSTNLKPGNPIVYLAGGPGSSGIETATGK